MELDGRRMRDQFRVSGRIELSPRANDRSPPNILDALAQLCRERGGRVLDHGQRRLCVQRRWTSIFIAHSLFFSVGRLKVTFKSTRDEKAYYCADVGGFFVYTACLSGLAGLVVSAFTPLPSMVAVLAAALVWAIIYFPSLGLTKFRIERLLRDAASRADQTRRKT